MRMLHVIGFIVFLGLPLSGLSATLDPATHAPTEVTHDGQHAGIQDQSGKNSRTIEPASDEDMGAGLKGDEERDGTGMEKCEEIRLLHALESGAGREAIRKLESIRWDNPEQKAHCERLLGKLKDNFLSARYHSIQGDSCATARYAGAFLGLVGTCEHDCPEGLLSAGQFSHRIIRNLSWLHELGSRRCMEE